MAAAHYAVTAKNSQWPPAGSRNTGPFVRADDGGTAWLEAITLLQLVNFAVGGGCFPSLLHFFES
jgi:hypothetical protein